MDPSVGNKDLRNRNHSTENIEEDYLLEDYFDDVDFDFDLSGVHSDVGNLFQKFAKKEVIKASLKKSLKNGNTKIKQAIKSKKQKLEEKLKAPPFLRTSDKIAFTLGIIALCVTEYILLKVPHMMPHWYTFLIFPLLGARYYTYHQIKYHYFMLDFCYYVQVLLLAQVYYIPSPALFQIVFSLSTGPLCVAVVMWRNSLVFHDLDKTTSVFIHMFPPLVAYSLRWYPPNNDFSLVCVEPDCRMSVYYAFVVSFGFYIIWQILYLIKTELLDREKLRKDQEIMTSVRWMSTIKPHPVYKMMLKKGWKYPAWLALTLVQGIYTLFTFVPIIPVFQYHELHVIYLILIFLVCIWNGANYYFEIFTETYTERLQRFLKEKGEEKEKKISTGKSPAVERKSQGDKAAGPEESAK